MSLALIAAAVAIRLVYFVQLDAGPLIELHRLGETDMSYYDGWGRDIAAGDWLSRNVGVPMHPWHHDVAEAWFRVHPERRAALAAQGDPDAALWREWLRPGQFYQDPLYPYLIGITYRVAGANPRFVLAWQLALGIVTVWLIWSLTRRWFGDLAAAVAGGLAVLCAPLVYYELILLRESTIAFAAVLIAWLTDRAVTSRERWRLVVLGLVLGLAFTLKSTFGLAIVGTLAGLVVARARLPPSGGGNSRSGEYVRLEAEAASPVGRDSRSVGRLLALDAGALILGVVVALAPLVARNVAVGVPPLAMASSGPLTFAFSNGAGYRPAAGFAIDRPQLARVLGETDGGFVAVARETLRSQSLARYLGLLWQKWDLSWRWFEIPNNDNFYYMRSQVPILAWLPVTFWIVAPFALVGLVLAAPRWRGVWPLYLAVLTVLVPLVVFYVLGRFRTALIAVVLPFAASAAVGIAAWIGSEGQRVRGLLAGIAVAALLILMTGRSVDAGQPLIRSGDWLIPYEVEYRDRIRAAMDAGDIPRALAAFDGVFRYEPEPSGLDPFDGAEVAAFFASMHTDCADLLGQSGRAAEAPAHTRRAAAFRRLAGLPDP